MASDKARGWIRISARHPEARQRRALAAVGCGVIYCSRDDTIDDVLHALRPGDTVVVETLARLAPSRSDVRRAVDEIHRRKCVVVETRGGRRSDDREQLAAMIFDAVDELAGDRRTLSPDDAKRHGKSGGKAKGKSAEAARTPRDEAIVAWRDLALTAEQALASPAMRGWQVRSAYRFLGKRNTARGAKIGRSRKGK